MADNHACLVAALLPKIRRTLAALDAVEGSGPKGEALTMETVLGDRLETLETLASETRAASLEGAMLQIALASSDADALALDGNDAWQREAKRLKARIDGYLYSVMSLLEGLAGRPLDERITDYWMTKAQDPHAVLDEVHRRAREVAA